MSKFKVEKVEEYKGYKYVVIGTSMGHRCGYVGISTDNELYGVDYCNLQLNVHGSLTYSENSESNYPIKTEEKLWWIGFDCAHYMDGKDFDLIKELNDINTYNQLVRIGILSSADNVVRSFAYVEKECMNLIDQIVIGLFKDSKLD